MKYIYVLVSDEKDYYYEQAFLSIVSLKMKMPAGFVSLLIDDITEKTLVDKRRNILGYINELKVIKVDNLFNKEARSRWLKTSMRHHIEGDFLFIDCDTVIVDDLSDIGKLNLDLGAVYNEHILLNDYFKYFPYTKKPMQNRDKKLGFVSTYQSNKYFNSGVMFCRDNPVIHNFFQAWHELWMFSASKGIAKDQPAFNHANLSFNNIITEIDGIWNCQINYGGIRYLEKAKIIHYLGSIESPCPYLLGDMYALCIIKENGCLTHDIEERLKYPKAAFMPNTRLITNTKSLIIIDSPIFLVLMRTPKILLDFFNTVLRFISSFFKKMGLNIKGQYRRAEKQKRIEKLSIFSLEKKDTYYE
jgi:hypothetical protein